MLLTIACSETTTPPSPTKLAFTVQPTTTTAGSPIIPAIAVAIQDEAGNTVTTTERRCTTVTDTILTATGCRLPPHSRISSTA